jgi:pimeloyl-ACP methyl ester carboxylesterase
MLLSRYSRAFDHLFVPQLPGYGVSTLPPPGQHTKRAVGGAILEALTSVFNIRPNNNSSRKIILIGHDRGARIAHRLAVGDAFPAHLKLTSLILMDIVPTKVQWESFSNPRAGAAYFHWPFLANVDLATQMIEAYGGDNWCRDLLVRGQGSSLEGQASFAANGAYDVYATNFKKRDAIMGSCEDYQCGSALEVDEQSEDMERGRKIKVPTLVMFSEKYLGRMHDVAHVWKDWVAEGVQYKARSIGGGRGHYLPEEDPQQIGDLVLQWVTAGSIP